MFDRSCDLFDLICPRPNNLEQSVASWPIAFGLVLVATPQPTNRGSSHSSSLANLLSSSPKDGVSWAKDGAAATVIAARKRAALSIWDVRVLNNPLKGVRKFCLLKMFVCGTAGRPLP